MFLFVERQKQAKVSFFNKFKPFNQLAIKQLHAICLSS